MEKYLIGLLVGGSLSLTGSGGALIALPLLEYFFGLSLKNANFFSLVIVSIGAFIGAIIHYKSIRYKSVLLVLTGSFIGSYVSADWKLYLSNYVIIALLYIICVLSLISVWKRNPKEERPQLKKIGVINQIMLGWVLGTLTTLTGLGGGVLLLPIYSRYFGFDDKDAVATSLTTIFLSSLFSFFIQLPNQEFFPSLIDIIYLLLGIISANYVMKFLIRMIHPEKMIRLRKISYGLVVIYTLVSITIRN